MKTELRIVRRALPLLLLILALGVGCGSVTGGPGSGAAGASGGTGGHAGSSGGGGNGGAAGAGGTGGVSCTALENQYGDALPAAKTCDMNASGQCQQLVRSSLSPCAGCMTYVNDASTLNAIKASWEQAGCNSLVGIACPLIACVQPNQGACMLAGDGSGTCTSVNSATPTN